ncbi:hypothetical protein CVU75_02715 [Candidatus Dependentiae bacterium HGW-Dependentiae-1]|nr:MAG: hypothetical protein CVU75_02715 [Candidatus Dependentiae bacterium HGW-Dependentiae-1]
MKKIIIVLSAVGNLCMMNINAGDTMKGLQSIQALTNIQNTLATRPKDTMKPNELTGEKALVELKKMADSLKASDKNKAIGEALKNIKYGLIPLVDQLLGKITMDSSTGATTIQPGAIYNIAEFLSDENKKKVQTSIFNYLSGVIQPKIDLINLLIFFIAPDKTPEQPNPPSKPIAVPDDAEVII